MRAGRERHALAAFAAMAGSVLGAALQLQQGALWHGAVYAGLLGVGVAGWFALRAMRWGLPAGLQLSVALWVGAMAGGGLAGWRAVAYAAGALPAAVEGRDLWVEGRVAGMPQHGAGVTRFTFEVASARWVAGSMDGEEAPRVPARISLAWYAQGGGLWGRSETDAAPPAAPAASVRAGERWRLAVRLRAPHGSLNPHGFDRELWMWERGEQASGQVRNGARDPQPERLASTWRHPVERLREAVRDAIFEQVDEPRHAGVIAALVTGDQNAIELVLVKET